MMKQNCISEWLRNQTDWNRMKLQKRSEPKKTLRGERSGKLGSWFAASVLHTALCSNTSSSCAQQRWSLSMYWQFILWLEHLSLVLVLTAMRSEEESNAQLVLFFPPQMIDCDGHKTISFSDPTERASPAADPDHPHSCIFQITNI